MASRGKEKDLKLSGRNIRAVDLDELIASEMRQSKEFARQYAACKRVHELARALATLREARGVSQAELARRMGTSQQAVSRLEKADYTGHTIRIVEKYVDALGGALEIRVVDAPSLA